MKTVRGLLARIGQTARELEFNTKVFSSSSSRCRATESIRADVAEARLILMRPKRSTPTPPGQLKERKPPKPPKDKE